MKTILIRYVPNDEIVVKKFTGDVDVATLGSGDSILVVLDVSKEEWMPLFMTPTERVVDVNFEYGE